MSPPPPRYHLYRRGVGVEDRSRHGQGLVVSSGRAHCMQNSVKYTQDSMLFLVGLQVNEHVFFNP